MRVSRAGITPCAPDWRWDTRSSTWKDCDVWVILDGRGRLESPEGEFEMTAGDCFWFRAGQRYVAGNAGRRPVVVSYNHFDLLDARGRVVRPPASKLPPLHRRLSALDVVRPMLERITELRQGEPVRWPEINAWFGAVLAEIAREDRRLGYSGLELEQSRKLEGLCAEVRARPERFPSVREMAEAMGYTPQHLARLFRKFRGESPKGFAVRTRIERAKSLLASTLSIGRIADLLGYSDVYFFSRQFKQCTGLSPRAWRKGQL
ncbi:MAG: helix-turn-helix domain-containing protein [Planctomycetota bacterium]